jgi:outer membrane protein
MQIFFTFLTCNIQPCYKFILTAIVVVISLYIISFVLLHDLNAEENRTIPMTIEMSIQQAFENNWSIKQKTEKIQESEYNKKLAKVDFLPSITTSYEYIRNGGPETSYNYMYKNDYQWNTTVTQPLFTGFALSSAYELAKLDIDDNNLDLAIEKLDLALGVKESYFAILKADKAVEVAKKEVESFELHFKTAKDFYEAGTKTINDVLMAEVDLANSKYELVKAEKAAAVVRAKFNILLSRPLNTTVEVEDILNYEPDQINLDELTDMALKSRPEIKKLNINDLQYDQQIQNTKSAYYPSVNLSYSYQRKGDTWDVSGSWFYEQGTSWQALVGLTWKFWDWNKTKNSVRKIESKKAQLEQNRESTEDQIRFEVNDAVLNLLEAGKNIPTAKKAVEQAEENQKFNNERYKEQVSTSLEVTDAQKYLSRAKLNYYNAIYDHLIANASLLRAIGAY